MKLSLPETAPVTAPGRRPKVLILGPGCNPYTGSEPGLTWNWAFHMSQYCTVHLVAEPAKRAEVERFLAGRPTPDLHIHWVQVSSRFNYYNPARGERGIRLFYLMWLKDAWRYARDLHKKEKFDLVHHVSWATVSVPSPFWRLGVPLVWGPLGGGQTSPAELMSLYGRTRWKEALRTLRVRGLPYSPGLRRAVRRSTVVLATNRETARVLSSAGAGSVISFFDAALRKGAQKEECPQRNGTAGRLNLLWAGKLIPLKGFDLALAAMKQLGPASGVHLTVAGDGPLREELEEKARQTGLGAMVTFRGQVPWEKMPDAFGHADAFLFTSMRDSSGSVVLEAASYGLPSVVLDIGGIGTFFPESTAIKIPPSNPNVTASAIAEAILRLRDDMELRLAMGEAARSFAETLSWDSHADAMWRIYSKVLGAPEVPAEPSGAEEQAGRRAGDADSVPGRAF